MDMIISDSETGCRIRCGVEASRWSGRIDPFL